MPATFGDLSVIVATSSGWSGARSRWRSPVPCKRVARLVVPELADLQADDGVGGRQVLHLESRHDRVAFQLGRLDEAELRRASEEAAPTSSGPGAGVALSSAPVIDAGASRTAATARAIAYCTRIFQLLGKRVGLGGIIDIYISPFQSSGSGLIDRMISRCHLPPPQGSMTSVATTSTRISANVRPSGSPSRW